MKDIQSLSDSRRIDIRKVGVKTITYPIIVLDKARKTQQTVAKVNMYVNLPHRFKGTHMSRFVEILNRFHGKFTLQAFHSILEDMKSRLEAEDAHLEMSFPYFLHNSSTGDLAGVKRYDCRLHGSLAEELDLVVEVEVPVALPCALGKNGWSRSAGLWGAVSVSVRMQRLFWIEDLIDLINRGMREPEVGAGAVESMCSRIGSVFQATDGFQWYKVVVKNIVNGYSAFASIEWPEPEAAQSPGREDFFQARVRGREI